MSWTNVPTKNPGDPVTAENWNGLVGNFQALAEGEPGAPRVALPQGARTTETSTALVLSPDGQGGVRWASPLGALVGGQHINFQSGSPTLVIPEDRLIYVVHGTANNTFPASIVFPNPGAALIGHLVCLNITQGYSGYTRIRQGSTTGTILTTINANDGYLAMWSCDGSHWFTVSEDTYRYEAPTGN